MKASKVAVLCALLVVAVACGRDDPGLEPPVGAPSPAPGVDCVEATGEGMVQAPIVMRDFDFDPECIIMRADQGLFITNEGEVLHNLSLEGPDVDLDTAAGEQTSTEMIGGIAEPGTYPMFCKYHPGVMTGELHILPMD